MKTQKRSVGRPSSKNEVDVVIKSYQSLEALRKGDIALAIEDALSKVLPRKVKVYVQTKQRLDNLQREQGVNYDGFAVLNLIRLNGNVLKFPWELNDYITNFLIITQGKEDFFFTLKIPAKWKLFESTSFFSNVEKTS